MIRGVLGSLLCVVAENVVMEQWNDRHTHKLSTVAIAVHVCQGLIIFMCYQSADPPPSAPTLSTQLHPQQLIPVQPPIYILQLPTSTLYPPQLPTYPTTTQLPAPSQLPTYPTQHPAPNLPSPTPSSHPAQGNDTQGSKSSSSSGMSLISVYMKFYSYT